MTIDKQKLKALAQAATQNHGARRVEVDHNGVHVIGDGSWKILSAWHTPDGKGEQNAEFAAAASPATVLALLAEIERLESAKGDPVGSFDKHMEYMQENIRLKAENEALRKQIADLWPLKNVPPQDFRASNKCLACGEYHHGLSGLPCPKMTPVAQAFAGVNQRVVPVEPLRIPHPLEAMAKEANRD